MTGKEKSRGSPAPLSLLDFSPSWKLRAVWGERGQDCWGQWAGNGCGDRNERRQAGEPCCWLMNSSSNPDKLQLCRQSLLNHPGGNDLLSNQPQVYCTKVRFYEGPLEMHEGNATWLCVTLLALDLKPGQAMCWARNRSSRSSLPPRCLLPKPICMASSLS